MCLWYDTESWEKLGFFGRVFNVFGIHLLFYLWLGNFVVAVVSYNEIPFSRLIESISISLGGVMNYCMNCNWPDGPMKDRKMLTFYKIRFFKPVQVMGGPFFIARWEAMADVSKKEGAFGYRN